MELKVLGIDPGIANTGVCILRVQFPPARPKNFVDLRSYIEVERFECWHTKIEDEKTKSVAALRRSFDLAERLKGLAGENLSMLAMELFSPRGHTQYSDFLSTPVLIGALSYVWKAYFTYPDLLYLIAPVTVKTKMTGKRRASKKEVYAVAEDFLQKNPLFGYLKKTEQSHVADAFALAVCGAIQYMKDYKMELWNKR